METPPSPNNGSRANLMLIGCLLARMVQDEVAAGRWYVDADGRAHPANSEQSSVAECLSDNPEIVLSGGELHAATQK